MISVLTSTVLWALPFMSTDMQSSICLGMSAAEASQKSSAIRYLLLSSPSMPFCYIKDTSLMLDIIFVCLLGVSQIESVPAQPMLPHSARLGS